ncbi:hypothetical protein GCM10010275_55940 [Streptomyces litmocidini]|uniref:hypothetical protein n=1 Tax=Streptomyces litmocidini TaxID=67318 RepID=UPI00167E8E52|nr:hypothetical protein [Streptomyces litmocidini]GGV08420.1 hypothetical protein GCM10010275_55940 [Streptomyces litmocidini]
MFPRPSPVSPCAVLLAVGYRESLFLAFGLPAWLAARRHDRRLAALPAVCPTTVRVTGLFLATALIVHTALSLWALGTSYRYMPLPRAAPCGGRCGPAWLPGRCAGPVGSPWAWPGGSPRR